MTNGATASELHIAHAAQSVAGQREVPIHHGLDALTGARFLAAFWVFNAHFLFLNLWFRKVPDWVIYARNAGDSGVTYFFLLSAFMMTIAYPRPLVTMQQRKAFWIARFARLYPLYLLCFLWAAPFTLAHWFMTMTPLHAARHATVSAVNTLLLVQDWFSPFQAYQWNSPGWTLSVDVLFYLAFPWLAMWMGRRSRGFLLALLPAMWLLSVGMAAALLAVLRHGELASGLAQRHPVFLFPTLLMGMALGFLFQRQRRVPQGLKPGSLSGQKVEAEASTYPEAKPEPTAKRMPSLLTLVGLAGLVAMTLNVGRIDRWAPHVMFYLPAIAAVLYGLALGGWPARLLRMRPLLILGDSVYAFYLTQIPLGCTVVWIAGGFGRRDVFDLRSAPPFSQRPAFYFVVLACDMVLSVLLFRFFETPWRVRLRRVLGERWLHKPLPPPIIPGQSAAQTSGQQT